MKTIAIHQPEYFPWLGFLDKSRQVDAFVLLDNVQFDRSSLQHRAKVLGPNDPHRYRAGLPAACAPCEHRETCAGGCGAAAVWATGGMAQDPFVTGAPEKKQRLPLL